MSDMRIILLFALIISLLLNLSVARNTIPEILYNDTRFGNLVRALQRTRLLREVNHFEGATLFAPVNEAFDDEILMTRERMLYHFLFAETKMEEIHNGDLLTTRLEMKEKLGLDTKGQQVKVDVENNETFVGSGKVIDFDIQAENGIIHVIDKVLDVPVDIYTTLSYFDQLQVFAVYLRKRKLDEDLSYGDHITVFAPTNDAIKSQLSFHEREYLMGECGGGLNDLDIWTKYHLHYDRVLYSNRFDVGDTNVTTVQGEKIKVEKDKHGNMRIAGGDVTFKDMLAENGVIHVITNAAIPNALHFTTHKYLCGLKATKFVAAIIRYELRDYIEGSNKSYTIIAPKDEYFDENTIGLHSLKYHIIEGKYLPSNLTDNMHIKTELRTEDLRDRRQRATVKLIQKWNNDVDQASYQIQFNGANVIGDPVEIGNDIIYVLSKTLTIPPSIIRILSDDKLLSTMNFYIAISNMMPTVRSAKGITMFAPLSVAFKQLGLINSYLSSDLEEAQEDLKSLILHHILNDTIYSEDIPEGDSTYYTIKGDPIKIHKINGDIFINGTREVSRKDVLTSTGVLHVLDQVIIPPTLRITLHKLLKGINAQTFLEIIKVANLTELVHDPKEPFTLLVPTEGAFQKVNVSRVLADPDLAGRWARLHIIPTTVNVQDDYEVPTLLSNDAKLVIRRDILNGGYNVEVKGYWSFEERARILEFGKTWNGGAVVEIDKVLLPEHVSNQIGGIFSVVTVVLILIGVGGIGGYGYHFWTIWNRRQGYEEIS